jgi:hypothetical protein
MHLAQQVVQLPPTAATPEAALLQQAAQLDPNIVRDAIEASRELEKERIAQNDKEQQRQFDYRMALLQRSNNRDNGSRNLLYWFGSFFSLIFAGIVCFLLYKGDTSLAIGFISHLAVLAVGYLAGKHHPRKEHQNNTEESD